MHKLLLKKIRLETGSSQSILHLSDKQEEIDRQLELGNMLLKTTSLDDAINRCNSNRKTFTYVIADADLAELDDLDSFLERAAPLIIRPGKLIIIATNLCTEANLWRLFFGNAPDSFKRPLRALPPNYLKSKLIEHGYFLRNRYWRYDDKVLAIADIPHRY